MHNAARRPAVIVAIALLLVLGFAGNSGGVRGMAALGAGPFVAGPVPKVASIQRPSNKRESLGSGKLLVATPKLNGPWFAQSVVLLLDYDQTGALGLIINQLTSLPVKQIIPGAPGIEARSDRIYLGGPVSPSSVVFLIRSESEPPSSRLLVDGIHVSTSPRALEHVIENETPASRFHAFVGYAGWGPGQLDAELARGDWWVAPAKSELIFDESPDKLWKKLFLHYGGVQVRHLELFSNRRSG